MEKHYNSRLTATTVVCIYFMAVLVRTSSGEGIKKPITYYIQEELAPGELIGNLIEDAVLSELYSPDELPSLRFDFISRQKGYEELFNLAPTGLLSTASVIDRDVLCPMKEDCVLSLDVEVSPVEYFQIIKIDVLILDLNDNRPTFEQSVMYVSLSESTPVGSLLPVPRAYDVDSPENGIDHYELRPRQNTSDVAFGLKTNDDIDDLLGEIYLETIGRLDREETSRYVLELVAVERHGKVANGSVLLIQVSVTDVNDNMPVFTQSRYSVTIAENVPIGTTLLRVTATDLDSSENGQISYWLSSRSLNNYGSLFKVDNVTGEVSTGQSLDYERLSHYTLVLVATDKTVNGLTGETVVVINVSDVNDNAPTITVTSFGEDLSEIKLTENSDPSTPLAHISIKDPDEGLGGVVSCFLNDSRFSLNEIYLNDFMLETTESLDREATENVDVLIICKDGGRPELVSDKTIVINVIDVNDNAPVFDNNQYDVSMLDGLQTGEEVCQVEAFDPDEGDNGIITYSIVDSDVGQLFTIDQRSGSITALVNISKAFSWSLSIQVEARDKGDKPLSSTTTVTVTSSPNRTCADEDDLPAEKNWSILHVEENSPGNTVAGHLKIDSKQGNCSLVPVLYPEGLSEVFGLAANGDVVVRHALDRERQATYCFGLVLRTTCQGLSERHTTMEVYNFRLIVDDQNDNAPTFIYPSTENNTITLDYQPTSKPILLTTIKATDADEGENGLLTFSLVGAEHFGYLWLDAKTGNLFLVDDVRSGTLPIRIAVQIEDKGTPSLSTTAYLWLNESSSFAVGHSSQPMMTSLSLSKLLGVAVPCGVLLVLLVIIVVCWSRRKSSCRKDKDRNHVNPTTTMKSDVNDHDFMTNKEQLQLGAFYKELDLQTPKSIERYLSDAELSTCIKQLNKDLVEHNGHLQSEPNPQKSAAGQTSGRGDLARDLIGHKSLRAVVSSQDSDSGCSADLSQSTTNTDSWPTNGAPATCNRGYPEQYLSRIAWQDSEQRKTFQAPSGSVPSRTHSAAKMANCPKPNLDYCPNCFQSYDCSAYIEANKVRKYGIINDVRRTNSCPKEAQGMENQRNETCEQTWLPLPDDESCVNKLKCSEWNDMEAGHLEKYPVPKVHRSFSCSTGACPSQNYNQTTCKGCHDVSDIKDNLQQHHCCVRQPTVGINKTRNNEQKKKIIYEAQV